MILQSAESWRATLRQALERYDHALLRRVAARLLRPRNQWPVEELVNRWIPATENAPLVDRRVQELDAGSRRVLAAVGCIGQPRWRLGSLVELVIALGATDGLEPVRALLEAGFLYPLSTIHVRSFEAWLASSGAGWVFVPPAMAARVRGEKIALSDFPPGTTVATPALESDGLEWPLRLAAAWQQVIGGPLRRTQQGDFFKRDSERLEQDALLSGPAAEGLAELPQRARLAIALAETQGIVQSADGELRAGDLPAAWKAGLAAALQSIWAAFPLLNAWDPGDGVRSADSVGNPYPSAYLLAFLLLAHLPENEWARPADVEAWISNHHPYWKNERPARSERQSWTPAFLLGLAHQLRFVQAAKDADGVWVVRLSPLGRWLVGTGEPPALEAPFQQTLLVQPNLEIVAYRQGLTPSLIGRLTKFAQWKSLGAACILQLDSKSVYRALESGLSFTGVLQCLEQHGTRPVPPTVIESLRTWADKRERLTIYPSAALLEFGSPEDLNAALARGVPAVRLTDRLAVIADESTLDYRHFRLVGTRDYSLPPEKCVEVASDGVTLAVDVARSDLLLETELPRFAERLERLDLNGRREYRLTPASLAVGKTAGMTFSALEAWFKQRTGDSLSPAARLLLTGAESPSPELRRHLVLTVATEDLADGLLQWPETRELVVARLGPTALIVAEEKVTRLQERLAALGVNLDNGAHQRGPDSTSGL